MAIAADIGQVGLDLGKLLIAQLPAMIYAMKAKQAAQEAKRAGDQAVTEAKENRRAGEILSADLQANTAMTTRVHELSNGELTAARADLAVALAENVGLRKLLAAEEENRKSAMRELADARLKNELAAERVARSMAEMNAMKTEHYLDQIKAGKITITQAANAPSAPPVSLDVEDKRE